MLGTLSSIVGVKITLLKVFWSKLILHPGVSLLLALSYKIRLTLKYLPFSFLLLDAGVSANSVFHYVMREKSSWWKGVVLCSVSSWKEIEFSFIMCVFEVEVTQDHLWAWVLRSPAFREAVYESAHARILGILYIVHHRADDVLLYWTATVKPWNVAWNLDTWSI